MRQHSRWLQFSKAEMIEGEVDKACFGQCHVAIALAFSSPDAITRWRASSRPSHSSSHWIGGGITTRRADRQPYPLRQIRDEPRCLLFVSGSALFPSAEQAHRFNLEFVAQLSFRHSHLQAPMEASRLGVRETGRRQKVQIRSPGTSDDHVRAILHKRRKTAGAGKGNRLQGRRLKEQTTRKFRSPNFRCRCS